MADQATYEDRIKQIVKAALADGVVWTEKQFGQIALEAIREVSEDTARQMFGHDDV